jgi:uncharacterized protein
VDQRWRRPFRAFRETFPDLQIDVDDLIAADDKVVVRWIATGSARMKKLVDEQSLCFAATVSPDGSPNLSPKGTVFVWSDSDLAFFDLASPQTVENLKRDARMELNVVDQRTRTGFRFKGTARVTTSLSDLLEARSRYPGDPPSEARIRALVVVEVTEARPLISPACELAEHPGGCSQLGELLAPVVGAQARRARSEGIGPTS